MVKNITDSSVDFEKISEVNMSRKKRGSMFDEKRAEIIKLLEQGYNFTEVAELIGEGYAYGGLMDYVNSTGLRKELRTTECKNCPHLKQFIGLQGLNPKLCTVAWRQLPARIIYAPRWCPCRIKNTPDNPYQE